MYANQAAPRPWPRMRRRRTFSSSVGRARVLQQPSESKKLIPSGIRDGAIHEIPGLPECKVITVASGILRHAALFGGPTENIDDVRTMLVHGYCGALMIKIISTSADES